MEAKEVAYKIGDDVVETLAEVATKLGVKKVTNKDISNGGKYADQVQMISVDKEDEEEVASESTNEQEETVEAGEYYSALDPNEEITATPEQIKESMPDFENLDELKEFIKDIDTPTLEYLARGLRAEWTPTYNQAIHRMRVAQALHRYFFPELFKPKGDKKKKAKYGDLSTDRLFELVEEHNLRVNRSGNEPIDRMRAIMALKTVGVLES